MDQTKLDEARHNESNEMQQQTTQVSDLLTPVSYLIINNQNGLWKSAKERVEAVTFRRLIDSKSTESQTSSNFSSDSKNDSNASMEVRGKMDEWLECLNCEKKQENSIFKVSNEI